MSTSDALVGAMLIAMALFALAFAIPPGREFEAAFLAEERKLNLEFMLRIDELYIQQQQVAEDIISRYEPGSENFKSALSLKGYSLEVAKLDSTEHGFVRRTLDAFRTYLEEKEEGFEAIPDFKFDSKIFDLILNRMKYRAFFDAHRLTNDELASEKAASPLRNFFQKLSRSNASQMVAPGRKSFRKLMKFILKGMETAGFDPQTEKSLRALVIEKSGRHKLLKNLDRLIEEIMSFKVCPESAHANHAESSVRPVFCPEDTEKWREFYIGQNLLDDIELDSKRYERFLAGTKDMGDLRERTSNSVRRAPDYYDAQWTPDRYY